MSNDVDLSFTDKWSCEEKSYNCCECLDQDDSQWKHKMSQKLCQCAMSKQNHHENFH